MTSPFYLAASVIDVDVTVFVQLGLFLLLLLVLRGLLLKPILALLQKRRAETEGREAQGRKDLAEAEVLRTAHESRMRDVAQEGALVRNRLRDEAIAQESRRLADVRGETAEWLAREVEQYRTKGEAARQEAAVVVDEVAAHLGQVVSRVPSRPRV